MPFDPRIVRPDVEFGNSPTDHHSEPLHEDLPPDLADLATKLEAEAAWLANLFPASECAAPKSMPARPSTPGVSFPDFARSTRWQVAVALFVVGIGSATWLAQSVTAPMQAPSFALQPPVATDPYPHPPIPVFVPDNSAASPAAVFLWHDATGPELEGLLDLMEDDALAGSVVSL